jgi:hypothetical protein
MGKVFAQYDRTPADGPPLRVAFSAANAYSELEVQMDRRIACVAIALLCWAPRMPAQNAETPSWKKLEFLLGKWAGAAGKKDTPLGAGQGTFSFELQLEKKIVVRHNNAAYDSGVRHEDLLIVYMESGAPHAIYFDSEGHVIRYAVSFPAANSVVFESDGTQPGPRYRLSYALRKESLDGKFEVAPPGGDYKGYMSWTSQRQ